MLRVLLALTILVPGLVSAQGRQFPTRPVKMIVPFAAGGASDIVARTLAQPLSESWRQVVVIDNRPGGNSIIGTEAAARSDPDGHTLLVANAALGLNQYLLPRLPFDVLKDLKPIARLLSSPLIIVASQSLPVRDVKGLIALSRQRPNGIVFGSAGSGSLSHFAGIMFNQQAGVQLAHIPYKGGAAAAVDLLGGSTHLLFAEAPSMLPYIRERRVHPIAVTGEKRALKLRDVPTVSESGLAGYRVVQWYGLFAPARTPREVVDRISVEVKKALERPDVRSRFDSFDWEIAFSSPDEFKKFFEGEVERWGKVARFGNIKME